MSERVGRLPHDCVRDELPSWPSGRYAYNDGDLVRCSCGRYWRVTSGLWCHYRRISARRARKFETQKGRLAP